ncbi:MAG: SLBB domain-containing protein [Prosthecobacter sp.]|uniref:SLBB domain-containing protein n=1 Tax=Prosthecobacter sp. TaxID=1965333 RepID=UPI0038FD4618
MPITTTVTAASPTRSLSVSGQAASLTLLEPPEPAAAAAAAATPAFKLPFDPLRLIDALVRRWWLMLAAGGACALVLIVVGLFRFETLHTARSQIIKQALAASFRQSESGETFKPNDLSVPTLTALMYSGAVVAAASEQLNHRYEEGTIRSGLIVAAERNTDILNISMTSGHSAAVALEMLKAYTEAVLQLSRDLQRNAATEMKTFLQKQIERTEADLVKVNEEMLAYGRDAQLIDADKQMDAWLGELGNFTLKYETLKLDHETLDVRIQGVERELAKVDTNAARVDEARRELASLRVRYTDEHPSVIESRERLAAMQQQVAAAGTHIDSPPKPGESNVAESLYLELIRLRAEKTMMAEQLGKLAIVRDGVNQRLAQLPRKAMEYGRIKSRQQTLETSRSLLAGRQREAALYEENAQGYFRLFAMARPQDVESARPTKKLALAGMGGLAAGVGTVAALLIGLTLLDGRIRSAGDLKRATGVPVIGLMPQTLLESEEAWAFRTWTRLQPLLLIPADGGAMVCGVMHAGEAAAACRMTQRLALAAVRRGLGCIAITHRSEGTTLRLADAVYFPECLSRVARELPGNVCSLRIDAAWTWTLEQRQQWQAALAHWRLLEGVVVLVELPTVTQPEALLLAEQLPNLVWAGASGGSCVQQVSDSLRMYRDTGCRLVAAMLDRAPVLRPAALARFAALLLLGLSAPALQAELTLGAGDAVNIMMPGFEGLERKDITIGPDGRLTYLQARDIQAAGLSVDQLREKLGIELKRYYRNARVVVTPSTFQSRKVYVLGKVVKKGAINLDRPLTLLEVIAEAGGLETGVYQQNTVEMADLSRSFVMRGQTRLPVNLEALMSRGDMTQNVRMEPGDYLYFPSANSNEIYVLGDVNAQGAQGLLAHTSVHSAIAQAGGFTSKAYTGRVLVIRGSLEQPQRIVVDMNDIMNARTKGFRLEPKDIVYIADRPWARAEELLDMAINAFLQGAVSGWTRARVGPFIRQPVLPQLR